MPAAYRKGLVGPQLEALRTAGAIAHRLFLSDYEDLHLGAIILAVNRRLMWAAAATRWGWRDDQHAGYPKGTGELPLS